MSFQSDDVVKKIAAYIRPVLAEAGVTDPDEMEEEAKNLLGAVQEAVLSQPEGAKYLVQHAESSFCPDCNHRLFLLCEEWGKGPQFYICFRCRRIWHVGHGRIDVPAKDRVTR